MPTSSPTKKSDKKAATKDKSNPLKNLKGNTPDSEEDGNFGSHTGDAVKDLLTQGNDSSSLPPTDRATTSKPQTK